LTDDNDSARKDIDLLELTGTSYDEARKLVPLRPDGLDEK